MTPYYVKIRSIRHVTHDVLQIEMEKPDNFIFIPGQASEVAINKEGWENKRRPFTFTCLPQDDYLQFTIKTYPSHKGVTNELLNLRKNDELILNDVFGTIIYNGEGVFIAGGAGVTPFISIFRDLKSKNKVSGNMLIFANKTKDDIILKDEFTTMLGKNFINILSDEDVAGFAHGHISTEFLKDNVKDFSKNIYLCGPPPMEEAVEKLLTGLQFDKTRLIKEVF